MECNTTLELLDDLLDGQLQPEQSLALEAHLETCGSCSRLVGHAQAVQEALRVSPLEGPSAGFEERVLARAQSAAPVSRWHRPQLVAASLAAIVAVGILVATSVYRTAPVEGGVASLGQAIQIAPDHGRTVNLVFASENALDDVALIIELPMGVELRGYPGLAEVRWNTRLSAGKNILPLELLASDTAQGQLIARLRHKDKETVFRIDIAAAG
jgi:hypothetical protein